MYSFNRQLIIIKHQVVFFISWDTARMTRSG